jgi:NTE family protein
VIDVPLKKYGSLDWRRANDLIDEGYRAAEAMRDRLLPLAVSEAEYQAWQQGRQSRRRTTLPVPTFVDVEGFSANDAKQLNALLNRHVNVPVDVHAVEADIEIVSGLDRYETITWRMIHDATRGFGLRVLGRPKAYAPPFLMLGVNLENTTSSDFNIAATARYLGFDLGGSGAELRVDGTIGSNPSAGIEWYRPIGSTPFFIAPYATVGRVTFNFIDNDAVVARYDQTKSRIGLNGGVNFGAKSDLRVGVYLGRSSASIEVGNPGLPEVSGKETGFETLWRVDTQDSAVVPSIGLLSQVKLSHVFDSPDLTFQEMTINAPTLTQLSGTANRFWSLGARNRVFAAGGLGTSFDSRPLPTSQFALGGPFKLGAYSPGELRGDHFYVATGGLLRQVGRLPDFMGGPIFGGGWLENGDAFNDFSQATWRVNGGVGLIMDTLIGPVIIAESFGFDNRWRTYLGVGRIFR